MAPPVVLNNNFENKNGYFPGETVKGQVEAIFKKNMTIREITLHSAGMSEVKFDKFGFHGFESFFEEEEYYSKFVQLFRKGSSSHKFSKGTYRYDFSFDLPMDIPSSFESTYGFVRHVCKVIVAPDDQTGINIEFPVLYNVFAPYDLNVEPSAKARIQYTGEETLCCIKGFLSLLINIDRSGYVQGEKILINAECTNATDRPAVSKAKLHQIITCRAKGKSKAEKRLICSKSHPLTSPGNDDTWSAEQMLIPRLAPSELRGCSLIDVEYKFKFQLRLSGFPFHIEMFSPIVIGTVPLGYESNEGSLQSPSAPSFPESSYPSAPPPYGEIAPSRMINISLLTNSGPPPPPSAAGGGAANSLSVQF